MDDKKHESLENAIGLLKQLSHPVRLSILCSLLHNGEMNVSQIVEAENGSAGRSQISQFLGKMRADGLVQTRKEAQTVYYTIKSEQAQKMIQTLYELYCDKD